MPNRYDTQTRAESVRLVRMNVADCASRWEAMKAVGAGSRLGTTPRRSGSDSDKPRASGPSADIPLGNDAGSATQTRLKVTTVYCRKSAPTSPGLVAKSKRVAH
jgi:hypothetical protein